MHCNRLALAGLAAALILSAAATPSDAALVDFVGFATETGGIASSEPGDELVMLALATQIHTLFGVDLTSSEATLHLYGLISGGASVDPATGWTVIQYSGGTLDMYEDSSPDHDWSAGAPANFSDGDLLFRGAFTGFTMVLSPDGSGIYEGSLDALSGSAITGPCSGCAYNFGGVFGADSGAQLPGGYDLQVDGSLDINSAIPISTTESWGALKSRFQR